MALVDNLFDRIQELLAESRAYRLRKRECESCNGLRLLLENERRERAKLIDLFVVKPAPPVQQEDQVEHDMKPIQSTKSWVQKRYELEEAERQKMREQVAAQ